MPITPLEEITPGTAAPLNLRLESSVVDRYHKAADRIPLSL